jgi:hypothetical protein
MREMMRRGKGTFLGASIILGIWWTPGPARAEEKPAPLMIDTRKRFEKVGELLDAGMYVDACPMLERIVADDPSANGARMELAECYVHLGKLASAWRAYRAVAEADPKRREEATKAAKELEPRVSKVRISLPPAVSSIPGLLVVLDWRPRGAAECREPILVDGGDSEIWAVAPDRKRWKSRMSVPKERGDVVVEVPVLEESARPAVPANTGPAVMATYGGALLGFGMMGLGAGFGMQVESNRLIESVGRDGLCGPVNGQYYCHQAGMERLETARTYRWVAIAGYGAGVLFGGVGLVSVVSGYVTSRRDQGKRRGAGVTVHFDAGFGQVGLSGTF